MKSLEKPTIVILFSATALLLPFIGPPGACADEGLPVKAQIVPTDPDALPVQGQPFSFTLRVTSQRDAFMQDAAFTSGRLPGGATAWDVVSIGLPPGTPAPLPAHVPVDIPCTLVANDPTLPVTIEFLYDGQRYGRQMAMLPRSARLALLGLEDGLKARPGGDGSATAGLGPRLDSPAPAPSRRPAQDPALVSARERADDAPRASVGKDDYDIHIWGRLIYLREDNLWAGVDGCSFWVMDEDDDWDDELASGITNSDGYFDIVFTYDMAEDPDVYVEFEAGNAAVMVEESGMYEWNYTFETATMDDWTGTAHGYGELASTDPALHAGLHILTTGSRIWRWYHDLGYDTPEVDIQWPEGGGGVSFYDSGEQEIHITSESQWNEHTIGHEYSHHWMLNFSYRETTDYCNSPSRCDEPDDCGHCLWCQESDVDAWREGFPDWAGSSFTVILGNYPLAPLHPDTLENTGTCGGTQDDVWKVEGNFAAFLRDIEDSGAEDANGALPGADELALGRDEIVWIADAIQPYTPYQFMTTFLQHYPHYTSQLWAVARQNGYDLDSTPPGLVTDLHSTSHVPYIDSGDGTIDFAWTAAGDDLSGIGGYAISVTTGAPANPGTTQDIGAVTAYTTDDLGVGTYYFNIRAVDREGNWAGGYVSYGPLSIRASFSADARPWPSPGWDHALQPRPTADCTSTYCPETSVLNGNSATTWWNVSVENIGEDPVPSGWDNRVYLDGAYFYGFPLTTGLGYGEYCTRLNRGPITVRGGRHMLTVWTDSSEENAEMNEFDNRFGRQWVWTPLPLSLNVPVTRDAPPDPLGGAVTIDPLLYSYNCDGLYVFMTSGAYYAVVVRALDATADYDCRLHPASTGATNGFTRFGSVGYSARPAGCIDAVLMDRYNASSFYWNVGVVNMHDDTADYVAVMHDSQVMAFGSPVAVAMAAETYMFLRDFNVPSSQSVTLSVDTDPAAGPLQLAWFDNSFTQGDLLDADGYAVTDASGHAELACGAVAAGIHGLVVYRDPRDVPGGKAAPAVSVTARAYSTPADLKPARPAGWAYAVVPRPAADGTPTSVPAPTVLYGDSATTYYNWAMTNAGPRVSPATHTRLYVDGALPLTWNIGEMPPGSVLTINNPSGYALAAGRHVLSMRVDADGQAAEGVETNNGFGLQWVWSPKPLTPRSPVTRAAPGDPTGGWAEVVTGGYDVTYYNCDGLRLPPPRFSGQHGYWLALAVMPGPASDVDPRLHEVATGATLGFRAARATSAWGVGQSDFVLVSFRATSPGRAFDVGVIGAAGAENYTAEAFSSTFRASYPTGALGPYTLAAGNLIHLHELLLAPGPIAIGLHETGGDVDWGLSLHRGDRAYQGKSDALEGGLSWFRGPGWDEWLVLDIPHDGYYCLAVWKAGSADLAKSGSYTLEFVPDVTGAPQPPDVPGRSSIVATHPNPFNPRVVISYALAQAGWARLEVFDLQGRRVRRLADAVHPAGRHACEWDGVDDARQAVPSGVYFVRLTAAEVHDTRAVTLLR